MANWADVRAALANWFNIPDYQADALLRRVTPTVSLEEMLKLYGSAQGGVQAVRFAMHQYQVAAVVAEMGRCQLLNPAGSGVDIAVWDIVLYPEAAAVVAMGFQNTALANAAVNRYLDQRVGISPESYEVKHPAGVGTSDNNAATGLAAADVIERQRAALGKNVWEMHGRIVVPPGFGFRVVDETLDAKFKVTIYTSETVRQKL